MAGDAPMGQPPHGYFALGQPVPQQEQSSQESRPIQGQAANQLGQANMAVQGSSGGSTRGSKWTVEQEAWLVINTMREVTSDWLAANFPNRARGQHAITGHIADMKSKGRLPRSWRAKTWGDEVPYTPDEDVEIIQWHVWGREHIDPQVFVANDRAGGSIIARANFLCQDEVLVAAIAKIEEGIRKFTLAHDRYLYGGMETSIPSIRLMASELRETEDNSTSFIKSELRQSMARRGYLVDPRPFAR